MVSVSVRVSKEVRSKGRAYETEGVSEGLRLTLSVSVSVSLTLTLTQCRARVTFE